MLNSKPKTESDLPLPAFLAVGTFVVDYHKVVDHYPGERSGTRVTREVVGNGGAPLNVLINLARLKVDFPLFAAARVGRDLDGKFILEICEEHGINTSQVIPIEGSSTGYTDVYTVESSGRHTCFHFNGTGDTFSRKDVKLRAIAPRMLFLGALGALGKMDEFNPEYGRRGSTQLVRDARKQNITTVVEISPIDRVAKLDSYAETLAEADYLIINDRVTEALVDLELYSENRFDPELVRRAGQKLLDCGLRKAVIIQSGAGAAYVGADGSFKYQAGFFLPWDKRAGSAGVDHAFGAGFLEGLYHSKPIDRCLQQGLAVSTVCRRDLTTSGGITSLSECMKFCDQLGLVVA
ncbi:MAG: carbohydrate kinase family protein [Verrucomicrobiota bacterium]